MIADDHSLSLNRIVETMAEAQGVRPPQWHRPYIPLYAASAVYEFACRPFGVSSLML